MMDIPTSIDPPNSVILSENLDTKTLTELTPVVYRELRALARHYLTREAPGHTLQATALVHEVYLQLVRQKRVNWQNRAHFFAVAAMLMRRILLQHARGRSASKRGGNLHKLSLDTVQDEVAGIPKTPQSIDLLALDDALVALAEFDVQLSRIVELRYFTGLSIQQCAEVLSVSESTVKRQWALARSWLQVYLSE
jgi:RNA polymerase sigma factor (TIGR02999 family)